MFSLDDFRKVKSINMSSYFKILKPTYIYLKITPDTSIRNYNSATIAKTIQNLHKTLINRIQRDSKVWTFECPAKVSFYIYIEKNNAEFYFIVPGLYEDLMVEKISGVWDKATIEKVTEVPNCQEFLRSKLSQIAKFGGKPIISCHYLGQISLIRNELKAANSSYMLISGGDKDNFKELKEELDPYTLEDLLNLKRYYSLNLVKYEGGWAKFISQLPRPIK